jgi:UDP-N-acetylmuramoyl-tripeptide--D-alanyl-D-alanine ligase
MQIAALYEKFLDSSGISTDTRKIEEGNIFLALKGENFNGNLFAKQALDKGAKLIVADEKHFADHDHILIVDDVLNTLQKLANHHRLQLSLKVIAIGGSNGKTTTKELISQVLGSAYKTFATKGNLNNHIGVPITLLSISAETEIAIIEMGANHIGETALLCNIAQPDFGLITNNGKDHLEGYGSMEGVRKGNGELYDFLRSNNGISFVCADQPDLMAASIDMKRITYGQHDNADCRGRITERFPFLEVEWMNENVVLTSNLIGQYNFDNMMAAVAVGHFFEVSPEMIREAIASYIPSNNRSQILKQGSNTFILDAYNANPSSMMAALENFKLMPVDNKIVILGDMLELGKVSSEEHKQIVEVVMKENFRKAIFVGEEFGNVLAGKFGEALHFNTVTALKDWFDQQNFSGYTFLLKGSRRIGLEKLVL